MNKEKILKKLDLLFFWGLVFGFGWYAPRNVPLGIAVAIILIPFEYLEYRKNGFVTGSNYVVKIVGATCFFVAIVRGMYYLTVELPQEWNFFILFFSIVIPFVLFIGGRIGKNIWSSKLKYGKPESRSELKIA